ncbi:hypothetical protein SZMC14600_17784, partial [Saccharomonospora azurea SZMC 14600]
MCTSVAAPGLGNVPSAIIWQRSAALPRYAISKGLGTLGVARFVSRDKTAITESPRRTGIASRRIGGRGTSAVP